MVVLILEFNTGAGRGLGGCHLQASLIKIFADFVTRYERERGKEKGVKMILSLRSLGFIPF